MHVALAERLVEMAEVIRAGAAAGDPVFARHLADGHAGIYDTVHAHLTRHKAAIAAAFA